MTIYFHYNCPQEFSLALCYYSGVVVLGFVSNLTVQKKRIFLKFSSYATKISHLLLSLTDYVIYLRKRVLTIWGSIEKECESEKVRQATEATAAARKKRKERI